LRFAPRHRFIFQQQGGGKVELPTLVSNQSQEFKRSTMLRTQGCNKNARIQNDLIDSAHLLCPSTMAVSLPALLRVAFSLLITFSAADRTRQVTPETIH
jgi:hypothetical protein